MIKRCIDCKTIKNLPEFHKLKTSKDGHSNHCKTCVKEYGAKRYIKKREAIKVVHKKWYEKNKAKVYIKNKIWQSKNLKKVRQCQAKWRARNIERIKIEHRHRRINNPAGGLLYAARYRAKKNDIPFNLHQNDIVLPIKCPVFGMPLDYSFKNGARHPRPNSPSLDRIIPELGYTKGNVLVVSFKANNIKGGASIRELQTIADYYSRYLH